MASRRYRVSLRERSLEVEVQDGEAGPEVTVNGRALRAVLGPPQAGGVRRLRLDERTVEVIAARTGEGAALALEGVALEVEVEDERTARLARFGGGAQRRTGQEVVRAPMPGLVVRVNVQAGQSLQRGECLVVLQAMKMENELGSPRDATVKAVSIQPGQAVEHGQVLVELE